MGRPSLLFEKRVRARTQPLDLKVMTREQVC